MLNVNSVATIKTAQPIVFGGIIVTYDIIIVTFDGGSGGGYTSAFKGDN
jgi:hypothetical protein